MPAQVTLWCFRNFAGLTRLYLHITMVCFLLTLFGGAAGEWERLSCISYDGTDSTTVCLKRSVGETLSFSLPEDVPEKRDHRTRHRYQGSEVCFYPETVFVFSPCVSGQEQRVYFLRPEPVFDQLLISSYLRGPPVWSFT